VGQDKSLGGADRRGRQPFRGGKRYRFEPEFALTVGRSDMDVGGFVSFIGVKVKTK
jgi:hypothetical protein